MKNKTVVIGCGGSGIQTLIRLNAMLAGNSGCIEDMYEDLIYIPVDTDTKDTEALEKAIKEQMCGVKPPLICPIALGGKGEFATLESIVRKYFMEDASYRADPQGFARLKKFWWHCPNEDGVPGEGLPFRGIGFKKLNEGAGQCGAVSFLATWAILPDLRQKLERVCNQSLLRRTSREPWNIYVVAGTAGGTGRGSWMLVAFKVFQCLQEILGEEKVPNPPEGIFFDASCFDALDTAKPADALRKKINSLTAFSELSAWLELTTGDGYKFSLPSLENPGENEDTDVVHVRQNGNVCEQSPVRSAYIIAKKNQNGLALAEPKEYYEMAGAALYSLIAESSVAADLNNRPERIGSLSSCTFELDSNRLNFYLKNEVQRAFANKLTECSGDELAKDADDIIGKPFSASEESVDLNEDSFFAKTGFDVSDNISEAVTGEAPSRTLLTALMNYICNEVVGMTTMKDEKGNATDVQELQGTGNLVSQMQKATAQDIKKVKSAAEDALSLEEYNLEEELNKWSPEGKDWTINNDKLKDAIYNTIHQSFNYQGKISLGRARAVAEKLKRYFENSLANLTEDGNGNKFSLNVNNETLTSLDDVKNAFLAQVDKAAKDNPLLAFGKPFQKDEIKMLRQQFQDYYRYAIFFKIQKPLAKRFKDAIENLKGIISSLNNMMALLGHVSNCFGMKLRASFGNAASLDDVFNSLFVRDNDESIFAALERSDSSKNVYRRILKPIMNKEDVDAIVTDSKNIIVQSPETIRNKLTALFQEFINSPDKPLDYAIVEHQKSIVELIENNVFFDKRAFGAIFTFENILRINIDKWNRLLRERNSDDLTDRFDSYFGISKREDEYDKDVNGRDMLVYKTVVKNIVSDMLACCHPWLSARNGLRTLGKTLLLPFSLSLDVGSSDGTVLSESEFTEMLGRDNKVLHRGTPMGKALPTDRIVAFAGYQIGDEHLSVKELLDSVIDLQYWKNASLKQKMVLTESKEGKSFFVLKNNKWGENDYATGFVSPIFLMNEELSSIRWKPWDDGNETMDVAVETEKKTQNALLYALLGNGLEADSPILKELAEQYGVQLPLLVMGASGKTELFSFTREQYDQNGDELKVTYDPKWEAGDPLENSFDNVYRFLQGLGRPPKRDQAPSVTAREKEDGNAKREAILKESKGFEDCIRPRLGKKKYFDLKDALRKWIISQIRTASAEDKDFWEKLKNASIAELQKLQ